jgi:hypothetical protein
MSQTADASERTCPECNQPRRLYSPDGPPQVTEGEGSLDVEVPGAWGCTNPDCAAYEPAAEAADGVDESFKSGRLTHRAQEASEANDPTGGGNIGA